MTREIWKPIPLNRKYFVSSWGRIKTNDYHMTGKTQILKVVITKRKYCQVTISGKSLHVHRLVAFAFVKNTKRKPCINHIDNDPSNNYYKNLEWCTHKENTKHMINQNRGNPPTEFRLPITKLSNQQAADINRRALSGERSCDLAKEYGVCSTTITGIKYQTRRKIRV